MKANSVRARGALLLVLVMAMAACDKTEDTGTPPVPAAVALPADKSPAPPPVTVSVKPPASAPWITSPRFTVVVAFTEKAAATWGRTPKSLAVYADIVDEYGPGMTALGARQKHNVREPGPVHFSGITIPLDTLQALRDPDYEIYVGVEPTTQTAALDCGYVQQRVQDLHNKSFTLSCKLKGET